MQAMQLTTSNPFRRMHESTQRMLCRLAFVLFGATPLAVLVGLTTVSWTPWYRAWEQWSWEQRVSETLGITLRAASFRWTAPYQFQATDVEVRHPETDQLMAKIGRVDGLMKAKGWSVLLDAPAIDGEQFDQGISVLHDWFLCRPQTSSQLLALAIPNGMTIHCGKESSLLQRIDVVFRPTQTSSTIHAKWTLADQPFGEVALTISRNHAVDNASTTLELSSPNTWLPVAMVSRRYPWLSQIAPTALFRGILRGQSTSQEWDASVVGEFDRLDWAYATSTLGSPIRSHGSLVLDQLNLRDGRILFANGEFRSEGGTVSKAWMQRFSQQLALPEYWQADAAESVPVQSIGCRFRVDSNGLVLKGTLPSPPNWPAIIAQMNGSVVCSDEAIKPLQRLVVALQPIPLKNGPTEVQIDSATAALTAMLPWPASAQERSRESPSTSRFRSRLSRNNTIEQR